MVLKMFVCSINALKGLKFFEKIFATFKKIERCIKLMKRDTKGIYHKCYERFPFKINAVVLNKNPEKKKNAFHKNYVTLTTEHSALHQRNKFNFKKH